MLLAALCDRLFELLQIGLRRLFWNLKCVSIITGTGLDMGRIGNQQTPGNHVVGDR
ncbi:hypothetical protein D3C71_2061100 [compost metagenome]